MLHYSSDRIANIRKQIDKYNIISFDIFDTLLKRDCNDFKNIFEIVEYRYNNVYPNNKIENFTTKRISAEIKIYRAGILFPTIEQIYGELLLPEQQKKKLIELEKEVETDYSCKNQIIYEIYQFAKANKKRIIAISDMYLDYNTIQNMLKKNGIIVDGLYISAQYSQTKTSGELFNVVLEKEKISKNQILHIGDNIKADYWGAKKVGINSLLIPKKINNLKYLNINRLNRNSIEYKYLIPFLNNHLPLINDPIEKIGYETMGPVVFGFCKWVHDISIQKKYQKLLFCSRDLKQTLQIYRKLYPNDQRAEYFYVSLASLRTPYNYCISEDNCDSHSKEQYYLLREYLKNKDCFGKRIAIIDSGFGGHTENMMKKILGNDCDIHGLYIRISNDFHKNVDDLEAAPYLFTKKNATLSKIGGAFFETMISATHGRTLYYKRNIEGNIIPVLGQKNKNNYGIKLFQSGIDKFVSDWQKLDFNNYPINNKAIEKAFINFTFFPKKEDVSFLKDLSGGNEKLEKIVIQREYKEYLKDPLQFFKDLKNTYWKGGFFVNVFPFPKIICYPYLLLNYICQKIAGF